MSADLGTTPLWKQSSHSLFLCKHSYWCLFSRCLNAIAGCQDNPSEKGPQESSSPHHPAQAGLTEAARASSLPVSTVTQHLVVKDQAAGTDQPPSSPRAARCPCSVFDHQHSSRKSSCCLSRSFHFLTPAEVSLCWHHPYKPRQRFQNLPLCPVPSHPPALPFSSGAPPRTPRLTKWCPDKLVFPSAVMDHFWAQGCCPGECNSFPKHLDFPAASLRRPPTSFPKVCSPKTRSLHNASLLPHSCRTQ